MHNIKYDIIIIMRAHVRRETHAAKYVLHIIPQTSCVGKVEKIFNRFPRRIRRVCVCQYYTYRRQRIYQVYLPAYYVVEPRDDAMAGEMCGEGVLRRNENRDKRNVCGEGWLWTLLENTRMSYNIIMSLYIFWH